jgi:hypothetical protein
MADRADYWPDMEKLALFEDELIVVCSPRFRAGDIPTSPGEIMTCPLVRTPDVRWNVGV